MIQDRLSEVGVLVCNSEGFKIGLAVNKTIQYGRSNKSQQRLKSEGGFLVQ